MLKQLLSLPTSIPYVTVYIYIVSGFLPLKAQIDKKVLSLFSNVTLQEDTAVEKQLAKLKCDRATVGLYKLNYPFEI